MNRSLAPGSTAGGYCAVACRPLSAYCRRLPSLAETGRIPQQLSSDIFILLNDKILCYYSNNKKRHGNTGLPDLKGFTTSRGLPPQWVYHLKGFTTVAELGSFARIAHVLRQVC
jgi:hypothetical protein